MLVRMLGRIQEEIQLIDFIVSLAEREGLIRGWGQPLTPSGRRRYATASKLALRVCRTGGFVHTFLSANRKGIEAGGPFLY